MITTDHSQFYADIQEGNDLKGDGTAQTVSFKIPNMPGKRTYSIQSFMIWDANENYRSVYMGGLGFPMGVYPQFTVTHAGYDNPPVITSAAIKNTNIALPGTLEMDMVLEQSEKGIKAVELSLTDEAGAARTLEGRVPKDGGRTYSFALDETFEAGAYEVAELRVTDSSDAVTTYEKDTAAWPFGDLCFEVTVQEQEQEEEDDGLPKFIYKQFSPKSPVSIGQNNASSNGPLLSIEGGDRQNARGDFVAMPPDDMQALSGNGAGAAADQAARAELPDTANQMLLIAVPLFTENETEARGVAGVKEHIEEIAAPAASREDRESVMLFVVLGLGCALAVWIVTGKRKAQKAK